MPTVLDVADFGAKPSDPDCTLALVRAAAACRGTRDATLRFAPGTYRIAPSRASETTIGLSNHEPSQFRRVALHLRDCHGLTIDARGAELRADGHVVPLLVEGGSALTVDGLTIDWQQPLHSWGTAVGGWNGFVDVRIAPELPWRIVRERLCFLVRGQAEEVWGTYGVESRGMTPDARGGDNLGSAFTIPWVAEDLGGGVVRLRTHVVVVPTPGDTVILRHGARLAPGIAMVGVDGVRLRDVTVRQSGGMAIYAQRCANLHYERARVVAAEGRPLSANHDATHFMSCRGTVRLDGCTFERQLDDATNVHGVYLEVVERVGARGLVVRFGHIEQRGCTAAEPGERFRAISRDSLLPGGDFAIASVRPLNAELIEIEAAGALPDVARPGGAIESLDMMARAEITGCTIGHNRARGLLIACGGGALIEGNRFESPGPAIHLHGDANSWYEAGAVPDCTIRRNRFARCGYARDARWGSAIITAHPEIPKVAGPYHGRLTIEDNDFTDPLLPAVSARAVGELTIRGNRGLAGVTHRDCGKVVSDAAG